jgi:hypothetical protein
VSEQGASPNKMAKAKSTTLKTPKVTDANMDELYELHENIECSLAGC